MAVYNGKWSYFPVPQFGFFSDERLSALEGPFQISLTEDGKVKLDLVFYAYLVRKRQ